MHRYPHADAPGQVSFSPEVPPDCPPFPMVRITRYAKNEPEC